jgi:hypothetical protein
MSSFRSFVLVCPGVAILIGMVSQKGGVGKSTLARLVAGEYAKGEPEHLARQMFELSVF